MQIADYLSTWTGRTIAELFFSSPPLVTLSKDMAGVVSITHWDASLPTQPTSEQIAAALTADPPVTVLRAQLLSAAQAAADSVTAQVFPTPTMMATLVNAAMWVSGAGGEKPTVSAYATRFANLAAAYGKSADDFAAAIVVGQQQAADMGIALLALDAAAAAASTSGDLATALSTFESSLGGVITAMNAVVPVQIVAPAAIVIKGINA